MQITLVLANLISHTLICPMGKIKIKNFHVFDIHWLYRMSRYAIVKVDITERNAVTKCYDIVSQYGGHLQPKWLHYQKPTFGNESYARNRIYHGCEGQIENLSLGITVWHQSASLVMPDSNPRDGFFHLPLIPMIDSYILSFLFKNIM